MWYLQSKISDEKFHILYGKTYKINRKGGDLVINDPSISRAHSVLEVSEDGVMLLWDEGSKCGTYVNEGIKDNKKLEPQQKVKIKTGDQIRFGLMNSLWMLCKTDTVVCSSNLLPNEKRSLVSILKKIGGKFTNDWDQECTHLVMNQVSLTKKVVCAMASAKPIVTIHYWQNLLQAITDKQTFPDIKDFQPAIVEEELQKKSKPSTLHPNVNRKTLFTNKIFVFTSDSSLDKYKQMVECAGGTCTSAESQSVNPKICCGPNHVVVSESDTCTQCPWMSDILGVLKSREMRSVAASEIGLAIFCDSTSRFCNPAWRKPNILGGSPSQSQGICLVENTEDMLRSQNKKQTSRPREDIVIPPSLPSYTSDTSLDSSRSGKRPPSPREDDRPSKRPNSKLSLKTSTIDSWFKKIPKEKSSEEKASTSQQSQATSSMEVTGCSRRDADEIAPPSPVKKTYTQKRLRSNDDDNFKLPSPKKKSGVQPSMREESGGQKKGSDDDLFELPPPNQEIGGQREDSDDDLIDLPAPNQKSGAQRKETGKNQFKIPPRKENVIETRITKSDQDEMTIEDDSDEFKLPGESVNSNRSNSRSVIDCASTKSKNNQSSAKSEDKNKKRKATTELTKNEVKKKVHFGETSTSQTSQQPKNVSRVPSLLEFLDTTNAPIKEEDEEDEEEELEDRKDVLGITNMIQVLEVNELMRKRPPLRDVQSKASSITSQGKPNFKKFRKVCQVPRRTIIQLEADSNVSCYSGVPVPKEEEPRQNGRENGEEDEDEERVDDLFPMPSARVQQRNGATRNRRNQQNERIMDEWTIT